ncbi:MAG: isoprenylcysteine carboxylmethyltransferase family protein [Acidobacteriota bacterium]|nr:isoprenylcysteine carboxylmethyltransferase family protein [Acidobacteriota bacterium]MDH3529010.1 isoprenylcysteine carboxylmethyltransferase family protein [Acidobacteriota bacterium]
MDQVLRIALPVYFAAFFGIAFFWRSYQVWKQTGINPYVFGKSDSAYDYIGVGFRLSLLLNVIAVIAFSFWPTVYRYLAPIKWLENPWLRLFGFSLMCFSLIWVVIAQAQMGRSWRVGIDKENKTDLVSTGLFKYSRNPIFLGMRFGGLGLFLSIPNALTFGTFLMGDLLMNVQVRLEEEFLSGEHGEKYEGFKKKVRRWI